jgi:hypothetical protein
MHKKRAYIVKRGIPDSKNICNTKEGTLAWRGHLRAQFYYSFFIQAGRRGAAHTKKGPAHSCLPVSENERSNNRFSVGGLLLYLRVERTGLSKETQGLNNSATQIFHRE